MALCEVNCPRLLGVRSSKKYRKGNWRRRRDAGSRSVRRFVSLFLFSSTCHDTLWQIEKHPESVDKLLGRKSIDHSTISRYTKEGWGRGLSKRKMERGERALRTGYVFWLVPVSSVLIAPRYNGLPSPRKRCLFEWDSIDGVEFDCRYLANVDGQRRVRQRMPFGVGSKSFFVVLWRL